MPAVRPRDRRRLAWFILLPCDLHHSGFQAAKVRHNNIKSPKCRVQFAAGMRAITLISKSNPASQLTPIAVQFG